MVRPKFQAVFVFDMSDKCIIIEVSIGEGWHRILPREKVE